MIDADADPWLAVYSAPSAEEWTARWLGYELGLSVVMPMAHVRTRLRLRGRRIQWVDRVRPYFPRYVFCKLPYRLIGEVRKFLVVSSVVSRAGEPVVIPESIIRRVGALHGSVIESRGEFHLGDAARFARGPLEGLDAVIRSVERLDTHDQVEVEFGLLGAKRSTTVDVSLLEPGVGAGIV